MEVKSGMQFFTESLCPASSPRSISIPLRGRNSDALVLCEKSRTASVGKSFTRPALLVLQDKSSPTRRLYIAP